MIARLLKATSVGLFLISGGLAWLWNTRRALPYNDEGRYFDPDQGIVLDKDAALTYGAAAIVTLVIAGTLWAIARWCERARDERG